MLNKDKGIVNTLGNDLKQNTFYKLHDPDGLLDNTIWCVPKSDKGGTNEDLGFSIDFNKDRSKVTNISFSLDSEYGEGPSAYTGSGIELGKLIKALQVVQKYML